MIPSRHYQRGFDYDPENFPRSHREQENVRSYPALRRGSPESRVVDPRYRSWLLAGWGLWRPQRRIGQARRVSRGKAMRLYMAGKGQRRADRPRSA